MTKEKRNAKIIVNSRLEKSVNIPLSDDVTIEVIHAFRDIIIELINHIYSADK
ncbi:MAG: hypothetical protein J1F11_11130 [Oscillospiraceae bacterium]|nr:hypothetical protein [Oscillospiraceae bacterium]